MHLLPLATENTSTAIGQQQILRNSGTNLGPWTNSWLWFWTSISLKMGPVVLDCPLFLMVIKGIKLENIFWSVLYNVKCLYFGDLLKFWQGVLHICWENNVLTENCKVLDIQINISVISCFGLKGNLMIQNNWVLSEKKSICFHKVSDYINVLTM